MQVMNRMGRQLAPQSAPRFGIKSQIVVDDPPFFKIGVDRIPHIRVGVPTDEEHRINKRGLLPQPMFLGQLSSFLHKFL